MPRLSEGLSRPEGRRSQRGLRVAAGALAATVALGAGSATASGGETSLPRSPEEIARIKVEQRGIERSVFTDFSANTARMPDIFDRALRVHAAQNGTTTEGFRAKGNRTYDLNITTGGNERTGYKWKGLRANYNDGQLRSVIIANGLRAPLDIKKSPQTYDSIRIDRTKGGWVIDTTTPGNSRMAPSSSVATPSFTLSTLPRMAMGSRVESTTAMSDLNAQMSNVLDTYSEQIGLPEAPRQ